MLAFNLFDQAEPELLHWLKINSEKVLHTERTLIIREGARDAGLYIVESGRLLISTSNSDGSSVPLAEQGTGSVVGEMSWLEGRPAVADVMAEAGSQLLHLSNKALGTLQQGSQKASSQLFRCIGKKLSLQIQSQNAWIHRFTSSTQEPLRKVLVFFAELNDQDIDWLRQLGELQKLPAGALIIDEGAPVKAMSLILAGEARIQVSHQNQLKVVGSSRRGELLGEMSLLNKDASGASARVDTQEGLELLSFNIKILLEELERDPIRATRLWRALSLMLSQRSRDQLLERGLAAKSKKAEMLNEDQEINVNELSGISTAGIRFDWLCRQLQIKGS